MVADVVEITLCPDVYSGNGGVCSNGVHCWSISFLMAVTGRTRLNLYLLFQHDTKASLKPSETIACA